MSLNEWCEILYWFLPSRQRGVWRAKSELRRLIKRGVPSEAAVQRVAENGKFGQDELAEATSEVLGCTRDEARQLLFAGRYSRLRKAAD
jgi:hypothetical protein